MKLAMMLLVLPILAWADMDCSSDNLLDYEKDICKGEDAEDSISMFNIKSFYYVSTSETGSGCTSIEMVAELFEFEGNEWKSELVNLDCDNWERHTYVCYAQAKINMLNKIKSGNYKLNKCSQLDYAQILSAPIDNNRIKPGWFKCDDPSNKVKALVCGSGTMSLYDQYLKQVYTLLEPHIKDTSDVIRFNVSKKLWSEPDGSICRRYYGKSWEGCIENKYYEDAKYIRDDYIRIIMEK